MITQHDVDREKARIIKTSSWQYIKEWYRLGRPSKKWNTLSCVSYLVYVSFYLLLAIFAAKTIDALYTGNWTMAYIWLLAEILSIIVRNIALEFKYRSYSKCFESIYQNVQTAIYDKLYSCKKSNFNETSKEQIMQTILSNTNQMGNFQDNLVVAGGNLIIAVVSLVTIFVMNYWAGLIVVGLAIIDFFVLKYLNKVIGKWNKKTYDEKDQIIEEASKIIDGKNVISEFNQKEFYKERYLEKSKKYCDARKKYYDWYSFRVNGFFALWKVVIYAITFFLIYMISKGSLDITLYLVIVAYLSTCTENFNTLFNVGEAIENVKIAVDRIKTILNFSDDELKKFGDNKYKIKGSDLKFINVSYSNIDRANEYYGKIEKLDISFKEREINIIHGDKDCGKRVIFNLLRRRIIPDSGVIILDEVDLLRYDDSIYKENIYYVAGKPLFLHSSIIDNFTVVTKNKKEIEEMCKKTHIYDWIKAQPLEFNTVIDDSMDAYMGFLLGLTRSLLTGCKILMIYEFPKGITKKQEQEILVLLRELVEEITIIIFTYNNALDEFAKVVYEIDDGKVKNYIVKDVGLAVIGQQISPTRGKRLGPSAINPKK